MTNTEKARQLFLEGVASMEQKDYTAAEAAFQAALTLAPQRVSVITNLAAAQIKLDKFEEAKKYALQSIELDPANAEGFLNLGQCLAKDGKHDKALDNFTRALEIDPRFLMARTCKSYALRDLGRIDEALACGEKIILGNYFSFFGKHVNLDAPRTFTEKLFCRMIHNHRNPNPLYTQCADKYLARDFVERKIGAGYLSKLLWSGVTPENIPFADLPEFSVLKSNGGSARNLILRHPIDPDSAIALANRWAQDNYYWRGREYQYYEISERLLIEEFLVDGEQDGPLNYSFYCFHGRPEVIQVDNRSRSINTFYDIKWNKLTLSTREKFNNFDATRPSNFGEMIYVSSALSSDFDFVRVDLYNCFGRIVFGEMTFTPAAGLIRFKPEKWDAHLGSKWNYVSNQDLLTPPASPDTPAIRRLSAAQ